MFVLADQTGLMLLPGAAVDSQHHQLQNDHLGHERQSSLVQTARVRIGFADELWSLDCTIFDAGKTFLFHLFHSLAADLEPRSEDCGGAETHHPRQIGCDWSWTS